MMITSATRPDHGKRGRKLLLLEALGRVRSAPQASVRSASAAVRSSSALTHSERRSRSSSHDCGSRSDDMASKRKRSAQAISGRNSNWS